MALAVITHKVEIPDVTAVRTRNGRATQNVNVVVLLNLDSICTGAERNRIEIEGGSYANI